MKNKNQQGRIGITGIIVLLCVIFGGFVAVKFLSAHFTTIQIGREIKEALHVRQGSDFTSQVGRDAIIEILKKRDVIFDATDEEAIVVTVDPRTFKVKYYVEYDIEIDLLVFKNVREVTIDKSLDE